MKGAQTAKTNHQRVQVPEGQIPLHLWAEVSTLVWLQALILEITGSIHVTISQGLPQASKVLEQLSRLLSAYPRLLAKLADPIHILAGTALIMLDRHSDAACKLWLD